MKVLEMTVRADIGGGPKHVIDLLKNISNKKIERYIAAPKVGYFSALYDDECIGRVSLPFRHFSFLSFVKILIFCKKNKINILHSHGRGAGIYSRLLKLFGFKVIHTFHGIHIEDTFKGKVKLFIDKLLVPLTDIFICVSETERKNAIKNRIANKAQVRVIYNGVHAPEQLVRHTNKIITVGTLSRLNYQKGLDILLKYFKRLEQDIDCDIKCLIAGDGELKNELTELNKTKNVSFVGEVDSHDFFNGLDIYISFARWEGLPIAVLEAMSYEKPCLLSNVDGNSDLNKDENILLYDLNSYDDFKQKLELLIKNEELRLALARRSKEIVKREFSIIKMCSETEKVYLSLALK